MLSVLSSTKSQNSDSEAMNNPRQLDVELIDVYRARRALDYLVAFNFASIMAKVTRIAVSGRVQSVALN